MANLSKLTRLSPDVQTANSSPLLIAGKTPITRADFSLTDDHHRFTFSQVPRDISDQIYGRVKGAFYDTSEEFWMVPCGQNLNLTFNFGGNSYPVHPLDTVDDNFNRVDSTGQKVCIGAVSVIPLKWLVHYLNTYLYSSNPLLLRSPSWAIMT